MRLHNGAGQRPIPGSCRGSLVMGGSARQTARQPALRSTPLPQRLVPNRQQRHRRAVLATVAKDSSAGGRKAERPRPTRPTVPLDVWDDRHKVCRFEDAVNDLRYQQVDYNEVFFGTLRGLVKSELVRKYWVLPLGGMAFFSGCAACLLAYRYLEVSLDFPVVLWHIPKGFSSVQEYLGTPLGFLLVFRANTGFNRWWDVRHSLGSISAGINQLAQSAALHAQTEEELLAVMSLLKGLTVAMEDLFDAEMLVEDKGKRLRRFLGEEVYGIVSPTHTGIRQPRDTVDAVLHLAQEHMVHIGVPSGLVMDKSGEVSRGFERVVAIYSQPIAFSYSVHLRVLLLIFLLSVGTSLVEKVHPLLVIPDMMAISYAFLGLDYMSAILANPLGEDMEDINLGALTASCRYQLNNTVRTYQRSKRRDLTSLLSQATLDEQTTGILQPKL